MAINRKDSLEKISKRLKISLKKVQQNSEILLQNKLIFILNMPLRKALFTLNHIGYVFKTLMTIFA
jgi:hypothetical protein